MSLQTKLLTYEDYLLMPETTQPCEIIQGELRTTPAPLPDHQWIVANILYLLHQFVSTRTLGIVLAAPCDVIISRSPLQTRQPDVLFLSAERTGITGRSELRKKKPTEIIPDLIVEVLSPKDSRREIDEKLKDYQKIGVREGWLVSPEAETIEVLRISSGDITTAGLYSLNDKLTSNALGGFDLRVTEVFK
jgi:Uma2 family endonuclease